MLLFQNSPPGIQSTLDSQPPHQLNSASLQAIQPQILQQTHPQRFLKGTLQQVQQPQGYPAAIWVDSSGCIPHNKQFSQPDPASYLSPSMMTTDIKNQVLPQFDNGNHGSGGHIILGTSSQIIPVLLHDPTMVSPVPSSCSSFDSSPNIAHTSPGHASNQVTLSTFQYPSPHNENVHKHNIGMKKSSRLFHLTKAQESYGACDANVASAKLNSDLSVQAPLQNYGNLGIDLANLPPPDMTSHLPNSGDPTIVDAHTVLDHREDASSDTNSHISDSGTIRRSKNANYTTEPV